LSGTPRRWAVAGLDLAWGERRPDGICLLRGSAGRVTDVAVGLTRGDAELREWLRLHLPPDQPVLLCLDAPVVCPNKTGSRPVDRLTHRMFHREQAGAHPTNRTLCARPLSVVAALRREGFSIATDWPATRRAMIEVYPHPATVRWFGLPCTIKYKRGPVAERRREFARLQRLLRAWLKLQAPEIDAHETIGRLLRAKWTKDDEDRTDAVLSALVGWQWATRGVAAVEILGDTRRGFIVLPTEKQPGRSHNSSSPRTHSL
jgi:predicted RNase H-like nuclease